MDNTTVLLDSSSNSDISFPWVHTPHLDPENLKGNSIIHHINNLTSQNNFMKDKIQSLLSRVSCTDALVDHHSEYISTLESNLARLDQYGRRQNIEIAGIPESINNNNLEKNVIEILKKIGLPFIQHYDIVGCHRLGKKDRFGNRNTIVRFVNRKAAFTCLQNRKLLPRCKDLGFNHLFIMENLCPSFKSIFETLNTLKGEGRVKSVWSRNGIVHFKYTENPNERAKKIFHKKDFDIFFVDLESKKNNIASGNV